MQNSKNSAGTQPQPLNHPASEEWMGYVYGELPRQEVERLTRHLDGCGACRESVEDWRRAMNSLTTWKLPVSEAARRESLLFPVIKWALAALVVLGLGFTIGRASAPEPDLKSIRAAIEQPIRTAVLADLEERVTARVVSDLQSALGNGSAENASQELIRAGLQQWASKSAAMACAENERVFIDFLETYRENREQDQAATLGWIEQLGRRQHAQDLSLRRALETVAVVAANKFQQTEDELVQLASYTQAGSSSAPLPNR